MPRSSEAEKAEQVPTHPCPPPGHPARQRLHPLTWAANANPMELGDGQKSITVLA